MSEELKNKLAETGCLSPRITHRVDMSTTVAYSPEDHTRATSEYLRCQGFSTSGMDPYNWVSPPNSPFCVSENIIQALSSPDEVDLRCTLIKKNGGWFLDIQVDPQAV